MPLLTINNLLTSEFSVQDPTGLYGTSISVVGSGSVANKAISLDALAAIEPLLTASAAANQITWSVQDDPSSLSDSPPEHLQTVLTSPYNAVAGDQDIVTNLTVAGAVSVVLSASAPIGKRVTVIDGKGDAATVGHNVTVTVAGGGTINGGANVVINTNFGKGTFLKISATAWLQVG